MPSALGGNGAESQSAKSIPHEESQTRTAAVGFCLHCVDMWAGFHQWALSLHCRLQGYAPFFVRASRCLLANVSASFVHCTLGRAAPTAAAKWAGSCQSFHSIEWLRPTQLQGQLCQAEKPGPPAEPRILPEPCRHQQLLPCSWADSEGRSSRSCSSCSDRSSGQGETHGARKLFQLPSAQKVRKEMDSGRTKNRSKVRLQMEKETLGIWSSSAVSSGLWPLSQGCGPRSCHL